MGAAGTPIGNMVIKLGLDDSDFGRGVENSKKQVRYLAKEMQANMKIADMAGNQMDKLGARYNGLTNIISAQEKQVSSLKKAYEESFVDGKATDSTKRLAAQLQDANGKLAGYKQQLVATAGSLAELEVKTTGATGVIYAGSEKMISAGKRMESVGGSMTKGLTVPILAGAAAVTTAAISWESAFAGVKKTNDEVIDSTGKVVYSYKDLEDGLRGLAKELPSSHQEIAAVAEAAGQLGIETPNVVSFTKTMIDLGESTNMSAETAATALARFANITKMSQSDFGKLGSVIVDLGNNFATTESEITEMGLRLAGAGKQIGMSQGGILGFAAALSSVGIEAEAGGSAFSKVMVQMQLAVEKGTGAFSEVEETANQAGMSIGEFGEIILKGGKNAKELAEALGTDAKSLKKMYKEADKSKTSLENFAQVAGMTGEQFSKAFKEDPSQAIIKFIEGLKNAESQGTSAIKVLDDMDIKEVRLRDSLLRASNASNVFSGAIEMGNKAWGENTALTEEANKRYETTESKLKMLKNEVIDSAIELGGPFVDALRDGLQASKPLVKMLGDLAKAFSDADPKTQQLVVKLLATTAAAGPLFKITGKLTGGIGSLGKSFVELSASMAKKRAITEATEALANGAISTKEFSSAMAGGVGNVTKFGSAAASAGGASGIGAMTAALGPLGPAILGIVGVGGALAVGYGAWKLFGEEAWNSSQRVERWGTDVGAATDKTLGKIQDDTQKASGQFGIMAQGFEADSGSMVANFEKIGQTIEQSLINKIDGLDKLIKELPASVDIGLKEMLQQEKKNTEDSLKIVQENTARITEIKQNASNRGVEISAAEAKIIKDLAKGTTTAYVETLDVSAEEKKKILAAMNADVANATEKEAKLWLQSLGKQRQAAQEHATKSRQEKEKYLQDLGYNLDGEFAQKFLKAWDEINKTTVDGFDSQMATITEKYPELINEVFLANGQLVSSMGNAKDAAISTNKDIISSANSMADKVAENAEKNAKKIAWTADESVKNGKKAAQMWNNLVFDEKTGEVKSNVREVVKDAAKDSATWNQMRFQLQNADLDSNAKLIIGEAAIANNWWDGMAWEDKQAVLKDEYSKTMYKALEDSGQWNKMSLEQKTAILYSNTPEVMTETMLNLGLWKDFKPDVKELKAKNYDFVEVLSKSEGKLNHWNEVSSEVKEILGDNYDFLQKIYQSDASFNRWKELPNDEKKLLADDTEFLSKILTSTTNMNRWNQLPVEQKKILGDNSDLLNKVFASEESYNGWIQLPDNVKKMLADNVDLKTKLADGTISLDQFNKIEPLLKSLLGDSYSVDQAAATGVNSINVYDKNNAATKKLLGDPLGVLNATSSGGSALNIYGLNNPADKYLTAIDQASGPAWNANSAVESFKNQPDVITKTLRVAAETAGASVGQAMKAFGYAKGTNFHKGGDMIVNDQVGPLYKEIVHEPGKEPYIPTGRNVLIPNAKRGTKVYRASQTKSIMKRSDIPHYAEGVGVPRNSTMVQNLSYFTGGKEQVIVKDNKSDLILAINSLKDVILNKNNSEKPMNINLRLGERDYNMFIQDISVVQGKEIDIQSSF